MCYYITATMAPNGDESAVRRLAKASLLKWEPLDNPGVVKQLHPGERYFLTTRGMCDCGTEIGVSLRSEARLSGPHPEVDRWIQFLSAVLEGKHADWIGILVHWYGGDVTTEAMAVGNRRWLTLPDFTEDYLLNAEDNTLHTVTLHTRFMPK